MTLIVNNDGVGISQLVTPTNTSDVTASLQIRDGLDFPHSGVFKALYSAATGNYALRDGAAGSMGFNFTYAGGTSPTVAVAAGKIFRDGKYVSISALSAHALTRPTSGYFYHLVVVKADNTMDVRESSATDDIPELTDGDIPIGLIKVAHDANTATAGLPTQFFTSYKTDNNLSIGYVNSNAYTPTMDVYGDGTRTVFKNKIANADIRFILADNTADEKFEILSDDDSDGDEGDTTVFSVDGLGATTVAGTLNLGSVAAAGTDTDKFLVLDSSGNVDYRTGTQVLSDIGGGTSSVTLSGSTDNTIATVTGANALAGEANLTFDGSTLAVTGALTTTTTATVGTDLTVTGGDVGFGNGQDATVSVAATTSTTAGRDLTISAGSTSTNGNNIDGGDLILKSGGGDGTGTSIMTFHTKVSGTDTAAERMRIHTNGYVGIGDASPDAPLHITRADDATALKIESVTDVTTHAPDIEIVKTGTPEAGNNMGAFEFWGKNETSDGADDGGTTMYARIYAGIDATAASTVQGTEAGTIGLQAEHQGNLKTMIFAQGDPTGGGLITMNYNSEDIDFRVCGDTDSNLLFANAGTDRVGIGLSFPMNKLQINHDGSDGNDGMMIVRDDATTADGELLGGIGFDSDDGNTPSSITEASAFIASYATEDHTGTDKGGNLKFGVSLIDEDDDTTSTILATVGPPDTVAASSGSDITFHAGLAGRATVVLVGPAISGATTYTATAADSGIVVVLQETDSKFVLHDIPTDATIGVQFTVINNAGGTISDGITTGDASNAQVNGAVPSSGQVSIADNETFTFIQYDADKWQKIG